VRVRGRDTMGIARGGERGTWVTGSYGGSAGSGPDVVEIRDASTDRARMIDGWDQRLVRALTMLGFGLPVLSYLWFTLAYSVNVVVSDQFDDVTVIRAADHQFLPWGVLWAQHNETRIFFPNLIVLLLAHTTRFNIQIEEIVGAGMLLVAVTLLIWVHKRRSPDVPWLYYVPVAIIMLTLAQWQNTLWGFQMAWFLVLLMLALTIFFLDRSVLTWWACGCAIATSVIGSYSLIQGFILWPLGLFLLYHRRRSWKVAGVWAAVAAGSLAFYLHAFDTNAGNAYPGYAINHPVASVRFLLFLLGDVVGQNVHVGHFGNPAVVAIGFLILLVAVVTAMFYGITRDEVSGGPIGVALIVMGLLFAAMVTKGRMVFGDWAGSQSRYVTFDLMVPLGAYLAILGRRARRGSGVGGVWDGHVPASGLRSIGSVLSRLPAWGDRYALVGIRAVVGCVLVVQLAVSIPNGISNGRQTHAYDLNAANVLRHYQTTPDQALVFYLNFFAKPDFVRSRARYMQTHNLSLFAP